MGQWILVCERHLKDGQPESACLCAVTLALQDAGFTGVEVTWDEIEANGKFFRTPPDVTEKLQAYDDHRRVVPFSFELPVAYPTNHAMWEAVSAEEAADPLSENNYEDTEFDGIFAASDGADLYPQR